MLFLVKTVRKFDKFLLTLFFVSIFFLGCTPKTELEGEIQLNPSIVVKNTVAPILTPDLPTAEALLVATSTSTAVSATKTSEPASTPAPTARTETATVIPTLEIVTQEPTISVVEIAIDPQKNSTICTQSADLEETVVDVTFPPFCIIWIDRYEDEIGFQIQLDYPNEFKQFVFDVTENTTQLIIPEELSPQSHESFDECLLRKDFILSVFRQESNKKTRIGGMAVNLECNIADY
jgi:hypothetical protein